MVVFLKKSTFSKQWTYSNRRAIPKITAAAATTTTTIIPVYGIGSLRSQWPIIKLAQNKHKTNNINKRTHIQNNN